MVKLRVNRSIESKSGVELFSIEVWIGDASAGENEGECGDSRIIFLVILMTLN